MVKNKVAERRQALGMTLENLSRVSGVPVSSLGEIEKGREPRVSTALSIAKALGRTVEELFIIE